MNKDLAILLWLSVFGLSACAGVPPPEPLNSQSTCLGISVKLKAPIGLFSSHADRVYFVRVDKEEDLSTSSQVIPSNYVKGDYVYLLNAAPGRYASVASFRKVTTQQGGTTTYTTFLPEELIGHTQTVVVSGAMAFMGDYILDTSVGLNEADNAQLHYFHVMAPNALLGTGVVASMLSVMASGEAFYKGTLKEEQRDRQAEMNFLATALESFKGTGWGDMIQRRFDELKTHQ